MAIVAETSGLMDPRQNVIDFLADFTAETTPFSAAKVDDFREILRPGTTVFITFLPGSDFEDTIAIAARLKNEGLNPVPHLAARSIPDAAFLDEGLRRLRGEADIDEVLTIAGAVDQPLGAFSDSMQVLETGLLDKHGIKKVGVAGHPEGSPDMPDEAIAAALTWKNDFANRSGADVYIVTQFCFEAEPIIAWDKAIRAAGNSLPIRIGVPGLATIKTLLNYAKACGIGNSMMFLKKQARNVAKLMNVSAPDKLLVDLANYKETDPDCGLIGCHMYPLGGVKKTAKWTYAVVDGEFSMNRKGDGFSLTTEI
ncbi:MAG: methylenetetrahydrofolate reductase [Alphaproteobacteria bacterium]|nr:methylenetetrahydrofolate reductase [Alphaproteobacteria bacterium]